MNKKINPVRKGEALDPVRNQLSNGVKILQVITLSEWGGAKGVCFDLVKNLDKEKFQVEVVCRPGGIFIKKLKENNIPVYLIESFRRGISPWNDLKTFFSLYKLIKKRKYDIVHCHSTKLRFLIRSRPCRICPSKIQTQLSL